MDTIQKQADTPEKAEALFAVATLKQRQALLDTALGKGWSFPIWPEIGMGLCVVFLMVAPLIWGGRATEWVAFAAGLAIVSAYSAIHQHMHRRVGALLRLLELSEPQAHR